MRPHPRQWQLESSILNRIPWFRQRLLLWSKSNLRLFPWREQGRTPYELVVAELLLQRTRAAAVARMYPPFLERFPSWRVLAEATEDDVRPFLRELGLSTVRTATLLRVARTIQAKGGKVPSADFDLEQVKGVGHYTANAILLTVHGKDVPLLDANMARVLERYFGARTHFDIRDDPYLHSLAQLVARGPNSREVNWAVLDLAALVCKPKNPFCLECPLGTKCQFTALSNPYGRNRQNAAGRMDQPN